MQTIFHLLPRLSHVIPEEWILPKEFSASSPVWRGACPPLRLYSDSQELLRAVEGMDHTEGSGLETRSIARKVSNSKQEETYMCVRPAAIMEKQYT